jgi:hypothetical protein
VRTFGLVALRIMKTELAALLVVALVSASCSRVQPTSTSHPQPVQLTPNFDSTALAFISRHEAEQLMTKIHVGMTVGDIREVFPRTSLEQSPTVEHGGVWFSLLVSQNYYIQFRAAHPKAGDVVEYSAINFSPRLRDRKSKAFISGEERPW